MVQSGIRKLIRLLENEPEEQFKPDLYMMLYTYVLLLVFVMGVLIFTFWLSWPVERRTLFDYSSYLHEGAEALLALQNHLQHVHPEASPRLLGTALCALPRVFRQVHRRTGEAHGLRLVMPRRQSLQALLQAASLLLRSIPSASPPRTTSAVLLSFANLSGP